MGVAAATWVWLAGCAAVAAAGAAVVRRRFVVVHIMGASMQPTYADGDRVLVRRRRDRLSVGSVVVLRPPRDGSPRGRPLGGAWRHSFLAEGTAGAGATEAIRNGWLIKRVAALPGDPVPESVRAATNGVTVVPAGALVVLSDNPGGADSRRWGFVAADDLLGAVTAKLSPSPRARSE
ncbi:MAG TPA: S26 family signal peptidase [Streptosporangiaceae bacterium]|nr:S26 family signal peptidase [Streptosporangiaceae bacterium]